MSQNSKRTPLDRAARTLIKAFAFAGAILGVGAYGLLRTVNLFGQEAGWFVSELDLGSALWWLVGGAVIGFLSGWILVKTRRRND